MVRFIAKNHLKQSEQGGRVLFWSRGFYNFLKGSILVYCFYYFIAFLAYSIPANLVGNLKLLRKRRRKRKRKKYLVQEMANFQVSITRISNEFDNGFTT